MKIIHRALALIMAIAVICCLPIQASAANEAAAVIDYSKTASLSLYKYDLTGAEADSAWDTDAYVSAGIYDQNVNDAMSSYAVQGVEFMFLRVADISLYNGDENGEHKVITLYGFTDTAFLTAIGLGTADAHHTENGISYFTSDALNTALAAALSNNATSVKNSLESYAKSSGAAMPVTDEYGHSQVSGLALGLYLVVETRVPENITSTCNPFLVSLPMTTIDGNAWNYDVTVYPKNRSGMPTLEKTVREAKADTGKNNGLANDITDGYAASTSASAGDVVDYQIISTLPTINLPISHGTEAKTLENYVGHVVGSSLPVGGESTHAVISGHSGLAGQRMFTDLHELKADDMVYIHVLDEMLAYEVDEVNTVLPGDTSLLGIEPGKDFLTLITCTPVGVNTHRLLVHCSRVPYGQEEQADVETVPETSTWQRQYLTGIGCGAAALIIAFICYEAVKLWRSKHGKGA